MTSRVFRTARRQLLEWRREPWLAAAVATMAGLGLVAGLVGAMSAAARADAAAAARDAEYRRWLSQPPRDPHSASHFGLSVFHVPSRLAALDPGVGPYAGASLFLEAHRQNQSFFTEAADGGVMQRLGALHLGTLLQVWLPLVVIVAAAGTFAGEREQGTLAQLLSLGVSPRELALGKMIAAAIVAAVVAAPGLAGALFAARLTARATPWPQDTPVRLAALAGGYALYVGFWIVLTVGVSARAGSRRLAAVVLTACWCATTVVVPRVALDAARLANPLPSQAEMERVDLERRMSTPAEYARRKQAILDEYGVKVVNDLPIDFSVIYAQRAEQRVNQRIDERIAQLDAIHRGERRDYLRTAWLSPAIAMDILSIAASGTDDVHYRAFLRQAEDYRRSMMDVLGQAQVRTPGGRRMRGDADLWRKLPAFTFTVPPLRDAGADVGRALIALAGWLLVGTGLAAILLRRVPAR